MSNLHFSVLIALGSDRIGIVDDLARVIAARGGNIEESKMAVLGGEFAAVMLLALPEGALEPLKASLDQLGRDLDLRLELKSTTQPCAEPAGRPYQLETVSLDTPGIVQAVASLLKQHSINIEAVETETQPAPWTGAPMFRMRATVILGPGVSLARLKGDLADIEREMDLDITLRPASGNLPE